MPYSRHPSEMIELIASMIVTDRLYDCYLSCIFELLRY